MKLDWRDDGGNDPGPGSLFDRHGHESKARIFWADTETGEIRFEVETKIQGDIAYEKATIEGRAFLDPPLMFVPAGFQGTRPTINPPARSKSEPTLTINVDALAFNAAVDKAREALRSMREKYGIPKTVVEGAAFNFGGVEWGTYIHPSLFDGPLPFWASGFPIFIDKRKTFLNSASLCGERLDERLAREQMERSHAAAEAAVRSCLAAYTPDRAYFPTYDLWRQACLMWWKGAVPAITFEVVDTVDPKQKERMRKQWDDFHSSIQSQVALQGVEVSTADLIVDADKEMRDRSKSITRRVVSLAKRFGVVPRYDKDVLRWELPNPICALVADNPADKPNVERAHDFLDSLIERLEQNEQMHKEDAAHAAKKKNFVEGDLVQLTDEAHKRRPNIIREGVVKSVSLGGRTAVVTHGQLLREDHNWSCEYLEARNPPTVHLPLPKLHENLTFTAKQLKDAKPEDAAPTINHRFKVGDRVQVRPEVLDLLGMKRSPGTVNKLLPRTSRYCDEIGYEVQHDDGNLSNWRELNLQACPDVIRRNAYGNWTALETTTFAQGDRVELRPEFYDKFDKLARIPGVVRSVGKHNITVQHDGAQEHPKKNLRVWSKGQMRHCAKVEKSLVNAPAPSESVPETQDITVTFGDGSTLQARGHVSVDWANPEMNSAAQPIKDQETTIEVTYDPKEIDRLWDAVDKERPHHPMCRCESVPIEVMEMSFCETWLVVVRKVAPVLFFILLVIAFLWWAAVTPAPEWML